MCTDCSAGGCGGVNVCASAGPSRVCAAFEEKESGVTVGRAEMCTDCSAYVAVGVGGMEGSGYLSETSGASVKGPRRRAEGTGRESAAGAGGWRTSRQDV
jgi:hypothetical protein